MFNPTSKEWAWMGGSKLAPSSPDEGASGTYGPKGSPGSTYIPGGRFFSSSWSDDSGNFWLFGGSGFDSAGKTGLLNDLWEYSPATKEWTWVDGNRSLPAPNDLGQAGWPGNYGLLGVPSSTNLPGGRESSSNWTDQNGNLWLFGGGGADSADDFGSLNDLWTWGVPPDVEIKSAGDNQSTLDGTAFATNLQVTVTKNGSPVQGVTVTFTAPSSGASGAFAGAVDTAVTNSSGIATALAFTANAIGGTYQVVATVPGANAVAFALTNVDYAAPVSVTPDSGFGMSQQFSFLAQENAGGSIGVVWMRIDAQASTAHSCYLAYGTSANTLYLKNDVGTSWGVGGHPGSSGSLSNSQCSVSLASTTVTHSGNQLTVAPTITFTSAYKGAKRIYLAAQDALAHNSGAVQVGTWAVGSAAEAPPTAVSVTPSSGLGISQRFSFVASSPEGAANLVAMYMLIGVDSRSSANRCYMRYLHSTNMFYLAADDGGSDWGAGGHPGSATTLSNSQCSVNLATTTVAASGNNLTVSPTVTFNSSFTGNMIVALDAVDALGEHPGLVEVGTWTP